MKNWLYPVSILVIFLFTLKSQSETKAAVAVQGLSFISSDFDNPSKNKFAFIGATLRSNPKKPEIFMVDLDGYYALGNSALSYLNIKEIYFTIEPEIEAHFYIGRKLKNWSSLEKNWNLSFFQPQFRGNPLNPESQGLIGLFWDHSENNWGISLFASPLFLPDQGPSYEIKEGQFQTTNPWFRAPPQNIQFQGQILPIDYNINRPQTDEVILRSVYAAQIQMGQSLGFFTNFSAAYKPAQQLAMGYSSVLITSRVKVDITPVVYNENLYAADFGYKDDWGLLQLSFLQTNPQQPYFSSTSNIPTLENSLNWGPQIIYNLKPFQFEVSYFDTQGGHVFETGPDTSPERLSLTQRYLFRQAFQIQGNYSDIFLKKIKWEGQLQYRFSSTDQFKQIRFRNKLNIKGPWAFWSDLILIETADDGNINMNTYRNLDQFWIGASYDI